MTHFGRVWLLAVGLALAAAPARADDSQRAKELFRQGSVYFDLGQYDRAIEVWQRGYEEKQDPSFLYNLAQAYRLSGDARKAILFYKSFLRNSPKAPNRVEIEERITTLQAQLSKEHEGGPSPPGTAAGGPGAGVPAAGPSGPAGPAGPSGLAAPAGAAATTAEGTSSRAVGDGAGARSSSATEVVVTSSASSSPLPTDRPIDVGLALGGNLWMRGVNGPSPPTFSFAAGLGYTFPAKLGGRARFRLGALVAYTSFDDVSGNVSFISALIDPTVRFRISPERLFLSADVGVGVLALRGLRQTSTLLVHDRQLAVSGTPSAFEVRPGLSIEYSFRPAFGLAGGAALAYSPQRTYFYQSMVRLELHLGFILRV